MLVVVLVLV